jgi:hypothetical protein
MLENGADTGTANLIFLLVLGVSAIIYLIIIVTLSRYIIPWMMKLLSKVTKKPIPQEMPEPERENAAVKTEESIADSDEEWICDDVIPEIGKYEEPGEEVDRFIVPCRKRLIPIGKNCMRKRYSRNYRCSGNIPT